MTIWRNLCTVLYTGPRLGIMRASRFRRCTVQCSSGPALLITGESSNGLPPRHGAPAQGALSTCARHHKPIRVEGDGGAHLKNKIGRRLLRTNGTVVINKRDYQVIFHFPLERPLHYYMLARQKVVPYFSYCHSISLHEISFLM